MRALIAGDMEAAVDASFAMGNLADALLLARHDVHYAIRKACSLP